MSMQDSDHDLDTLLAAARGAGPAPSDALMARVLADAAALQPRPPVVSTAANPPRRPWFAGLAALFGGGGAVAGISFAVLAGVFLGVVQPAPVAALTAVFLTDEAIGSVDLLPEPGALWTEE